MTVLDLIKRSMRLLGAIDPGDEVEAEEFQDGFTALNAMVSSWANRSLLIYTNSRNVYPLTAGVQTYQIGPNATAPNWTAPRPADITHAGVLIAETPDILEKPLHILRTEAQFAAIPIKGLSGDLPLKLYYDFGYSLPNTQSGNVGAGNVFLWPAPQIAYQIALYTPQTISRFTSLTQTIALPDGYEEALVYNLAIRFAPEFKATPSDTVVAVANDALEGIAQRNYRPRLLRADRSLDRFVGSGGGFDYRTGELL